MWIQKARADQILLHDAVSQQQETEKVTWAAGSSTRASAYTRRRSCLAIVATGPSGAVLSHLAHDEVRPQETGATAATVAAHMGSSVAATVNLGSGAVSAGHLISSAVLHDDGEKRNGWVGDFGVEDWILKRAQTDPPLVRRRRYTTRRPPMTGPGSTSRRHRLTRRRPRLSPRSRGCFL